MTSRPELPMNPVAPVVILLVVAIALVEGWVMLAESGLTGGGQGVVGLRLQLVQDWGFSPLIWDQVVGLGDRSFAMVRRFVTYAFVHGSFTHALFGGALLLALGKFVGDVFRWWAVLAVFFAAAVAGGLVYVTFAERQPLFGAYPAVYGLIGAFSFLLWVRLAGTGSKQFRAFALIGGLLAFQLIFGLVFSVGALWLESLKGYGFGWTWVAELPGFAVGFLLSFAVSPGGWRRVMARIRQR